MIEKIHLSILREISRSGSLTAAAGRLNLTQSALSHSIKKLEHQAGTSLWLKDGRRIRLTEAGNYLLEQANRLLPQFERLDETLRQFAGNEKGSLLVGMECHPCYQWLLKVVQPFLAQSPGVDIDVKQRFQFGGMAALFNYDIDLLITPDPINKARIEFEAVFPYELVLVVSQQNPLSAMATISPPQLSDQTLLTYPVETARLDIFQQFLLPAQCMPKVHKTLEATDIILQMVAANRGVAAMPKWLALEYANTLPISLIRLGDEGIHKHIYVGYRKQEKLNQHIQRFIALAKSHSAA
ncbi:MAG: LysR family transcriptional regulator [Gammaproteobacteria bacterium]|nr:LysR family transcriptional regulator [Gammaproteobacteria bacterium]MBU1553931.1 LysR family transcriptional regulator [Gammaproteobacteria bacterium]MBU2070681.1 LysR family transcriptional regulator [Gammaproteobacteria bacterium]MBU2184225.1 LysR family transcriptional regulator [Gammaproteobacteria bacterium]MBU2206086.1 LysR family transcriptional regulator [Gammaproteobacteria bacterium]